MRKYLFLIFLFIIYIFLIINRKDTILVSLPIEDNRSIKRITVNYKNGINSKDLYKEFDKYDKYFIETIELNNKIYYVKCNKIDYCINDIFKEESMEFELKYFASGFKINSITYFYYY